MDFITRSMILSTRTRNLILYWKKECSIGSLLPFDSDENQIFFFTKKDSFKLTNVFAVSFRGNLYIQQKAVRKYAKKGDSSEDGDNPNSYHKVLADGKFFYLEGSFANAWAKGMAIYAGGLASSINSLKGLVFDF